MILFGCLTVLIPWRCYFENLGENSDTIQIAKLGFKILSLSLSPER